MDNIIMFLPIILIHVCLAIYCLIKINKKSELRYLNKTVWILIIVLLQIVGSITYLLIEKD